MVIPNEFLNDKNHISESSRVVGCMHITILYICAREIEHNAISKMEFTVCANSKLYIDVQRKITQCIE